MSRLIHYGKEHLTKVDSIPQGSRPAGFMKPCGLWVSVEGPQDWPAYCKSADVGCLDRATEVILSGDSSVLRVAGAAELDAFHKKYATSKVYLHRDAIDWHLVAQHHTGIIIAPYVWSRRLDGLRWYYGWDCASGCIWDASAVESLRSLAENKSSLCTG